MDLKEICSDRFSYLYSNPEISAEPNEKEGQLLSEINEFNMDFIKMEPKEEDQAQDDAGASEIENNKKCCASSPHCQVPKVTLMRQTSHDLALVSDLYSLLEDFMRMAHSSKSLLCCQPAGCQSLLMCQLCGEHFMGKADRMHKLCKHYESVHPSDAINLILDAVGRYSKLIGHMRKALQFDEWFGNMKYAPNRGTRSFHCVKCKDCCRNNKTPKCGNCCILFS